jgi:hypothetical protein
MANILETPIIRDMILPFVLIFTLVFAILEKTKVFGEGKQQINAIIGAVVALIFVAFSKYVDWVKDFSIFLVIGLFIIFVFLMLWGFVWGSEKDILGKEAIGIKWTIGIIALVVVAGFFVVRSGVWDKLKSSADFSSNLLFIIFIIAAIVVVLTTGKKKDEKKD